MPKLNRLAEGMNRTIMEMVRSMHTHAKLSKTFWAEALMTTMYVINRSPSAPLDGNIPQRVWTVKDASYRHLSVFNCLAYMHIVKYQRGNLDPNTRPCIFLGCGDDELGYRLWNFIEKKVIRSRDMVFMEEKTSTPSRPFGSQIPIGEQGEPTGST